MPAYNAEATILAAIQSILNQSYGNLELLVCNDASTDKTAEILQSISDKRLRTITNAQNLGIVKTRNLLLKEAKGKYIAIQDADDISMYNRLEEQYHICREQRRSLVFSSVYLRNSKIKRVKLTGNSSYLLDHLRYRNPFVHSTLFCENFFSTQAILYNSEFEYTEDYELYLQLKQHNFSFRMVSKYLVSLLVHERVEQEMKNREYDLVLKLERLFIRQNPTITETEAKKMVFYLRNTDVGFVKENKTQLKEILKKLLQENKNSIYLHTQMLRLEFISRNWIQFYISVLRRPLMSLKIIFYKTRYD